MCGRIANMATPEELARAFEHVRRADILEIINGPRYNVSPQALLPGIRASRDGDEWAIFRWGLIPAWAKDPSMANKMINARAETVIEKPSYKSAFARRRCLLPVTGFYEWKREGQKKQPYFIRMRSGELMALAGLWETWTPTGGAPVETCTVMTTSANELMSPLHDRMPVIVGKDEQDLWLHERDADIVRHVLRPFNPDLMEAFPVSPFVNASRNDGPECIIPLA